MMAAKIIYLFVLYIVTLLSYPLLKYFPLFKAKQDYFPFWAYMFSAYIITFYILFYILIDYILCSISRDRYEQILAYIYNDCDTEQDRISIYIHLNENGYYRERFLTKEEKKLYRDFKKNGFVFKS